MSPSSVTLKRKAGDNLPEQQPHKRRNTSGRKSILVGDVDSDEDAPVATRCPRASAPQAKGRLEKAGGKARQGVKKATSKAVKAVKKSVVTKKTPESKEKILPPPKAESQGSENVPVEAKGRLIKRVPIVPQQVVAPPKPGMKYWDYLTSKPVKSSNVKPAAQRPAAVKPVTSEPAPSKPAESSKVTAPPQPEGPSPKVAEEEEFCYEELRARAEGWLDIDWAARKEQAKLSTEEATAAGEDAGAPVTAPSNKRKADGDINPLPAKKRASAEPEPEADIEGSGAPSGAVDDAAAMRQKKVKVAEPAKAPAPEEPRKSRTGGRKVVYESKDETPSNPQHHQVIVAADGPGKSERADDDKNDGGKAGKQARLDEQARTLDKGGLSKANSKAGRPARPQQEAPKKTSSTFFQSYQRPGQNPLAPKDSNVRIEKTFVGPPLEKGQPAKPKKIAATTVPRRPGHGEQIRVPKLSDDTKASLSTARSTNPPPPPSTAQTAVPSAAPLAASPTTPSSALPTDARNASSNTGFAAPSTGPSTAPSIAPSIAPSTAPSNTLSTAPSSASPKAPSVGGTESLASSSPKRKAEEPVDEPAAKRAATNEAKVETAEARAPPSAGTKAPGISSPKRKAVEHAEEPDAKKRKDSSSERKSLIFKAKIAAAKLERVLAKVETNIDIVESNPAAARPRTSRAVDGESEKSKMSASGQCGPTSSDEVRAPVKLENSNAMRCYANSMFQTMHSVPEIRDYFVSKFRRCTDAIKEHVAEGKQKGKDILDQVERSVSLSLGQLFLEMEEAVAKKGKASVRKFLSRFVRRFPKHHKFDGNSQEDTCELFHVVVTEIEAEEASSEELAAVVPLIKELFGVQKVTQLRCKCGYLLEKEQPPHTTLQVELPTHGKTIPLADCLSQTFAMQPPEGYCCDGCREKNTTSMTESIQSCGDYMLLNLDRAGTNGTSRTSTRVSLPEYINLDQYMRYSQVSPMDEAIPQVRYEVVAFAEHLGTTSAGGHYYSHQKIRGQWYKCNDDKISRVDTGNLCNTSAVFVLLKR